MRVSYFSEQGAGEMNEDSVLIDKNIFGVFDGATSIVKDGQENLKTGGLIASETARDTFKENDRPLHELAIKATHNLRYKMFDYGVHVSDKERVWCTTAAVVRVFGNSFEWLQISDSNILVLYKDGSYKLMVNEMDHDEEILLEWKYLAEKGEENIPEKLFSSFVELRNKMNVDYGAISGDDDVKNFIKEGKESLDNVSDIIIFTDGFFIPKQDPREAYDVEKIVELYKRGRLEAVKDYVRTLENQDPDCRKFPRVNPHDDATAIAISFD